jgi:hypothetical protein
MFCRKAQPPHPLLLPNTIEGRKFMATKKKSSARKYSSGAGKKVEKVMREQKRGTLKSGRSGKKVTSRKQAIAIGLSEARKAGAKVPKKKSAAKKTSTKKSSSRKK